MNGDPLSANTRSSQDEDARELLRAYLRSIHQPNVEKNVEELMSSTGYGDRFDFFVPYLHESAKERLLISGCAVGSEHIVARQYGFREICGTEVSTHYVDIARARLSGQEGFFVDKYDGDKLPYADNSFSVVYSGHVIEHTMSPFEYFREHYRVLQPGGFFFLEFPNRYHRRELHTGVRSVEWLPKPLRACACRVLGGPWSPLDDRRRLCYRDILNTLSPISIWQIRLFMYRVGGLASRVVAIQRPAPGFVRMLLRK